jgi:hypothetical protein
MEMVNILNEGPTLSGMLSLAHREIIALAADDLAEYDELAAQRRLLGFAIGGFSPTSYLSDQSGTSRLLDELRVCDAQIERDLVRLADDLADRAGVHARQYAFPRLYLFAPDPGRGVLARGIGLWS